LLIFSVPIALSAILSFVIPSAATLMSVAKSVVPIPLFIAIEA